MIMNIMILYVGLILLVGIIAFTGFMVFGTQRREAYQDDLDYRFKDKWSGRKGEELNAWYLVRLELFHYGASEKQIEYVNKQIKELNKEFMLSDLVVNESGNIESNISSDNFSLSE
jgi:hypothetical protein